MISYPEQLEELEWSLFGGQLQDVLLADGQHHQQQQGVVQYGFKQSTGLVKTVDSPLAISNDQAWSLDDFDDFFGTPDPTWTDTPFGEENNSFPKQEFIPSLPSSPELSTIPDFNISSFNPDCFVGFKNVEEFFNPEPKVSLVSQSADFVDFDLHGSLDLHGLLDPHGSLQNADCVLEILQRLGSGNGIHFDQSKMIASEPIPLPQMPPEMVESILSISPDCIESTIDDATLYSPAMTAYDEGRSSPSSSCGSIRSDWSHGSRSRSEPYPKEVKPERRIRKKEQNKTAALKYRQRKREEQGSFMSECEQLEMKNVELKTRVDEITKEINYLKGLMAEMAEYKSD